MRFWKCIRPPSGWHDQTPTARAIADLPVAVTAASPAPGCAKQARAIGGLFPKGQMMKDLLSCCKEVANHRAYRAHTGTGWAICCKKCGLTWTATDDQAAAAEGGAA